MNLYKKYQANQIPINKVLDYMSGNSGLTEEFIYKKTQYKDRQYEVLACSEEENILGYLPLCDIDDKSLKVFEGKEGLFVIRKGKAGKTRILKAGKYTMNEDAYILFVKEDCPYKINLKWLSIQYKEDFLSYASSSDNGTWNMTGFFKNVVIDIPDYKEQIEVVNEYEVLEGYIKTITQIKDNAYKIKVRYFSHNYKKYQANQMPINKVLDYMSGNSGLTEEFIYQQSRKLGKRYVVLSSSTEEDTKMGEIPLCQINDALLKVFDNKEGLLVIRNGKAGATVYLAKGDYTINDHAYILFVKEDCPYKINLKWLSIQYKEDFLSYASSSDNGTWNMTGFFKNVVIDIPDYKEQIEVVNEYEVLEGYEHDIKALQGNIQEIALKTLA